ncbi:hypothetical protein KC19_VG027100 [Ceratodon purpureus]|uniref:Endonuclease/exonuclease/phosphatase domain-containing protein n=1 Tax=Ceratodon purpureus TaxID=3225 RepID=A0A8T0HLE6_CERPU|nr:hypothetical protein KC19_VG027100 [Ceratodon purpureus]
MSVQHHKLNLVTQNICTLSHGTSGIWTRKLIRDHFQHLNHSLDLILLQEHHLVDEECLSKTSQLDFLGGPSFSNEARFLPESNKTKGGTAILTSHKIQHLIKDSSIIVPGQAQFLTLQLASGEILGLINVYAYSTSPERATLWEAINAAPLLPANWIIAGDFNMIETLDDKLGGSDQTKMYALQAEAWNRTLLKFALGDSFHMTEFRHLTKKKFTWDNAQLASERVTTRLDRIYVSPSIQQLGGQVGILANLGDILDHAPYVLKINQPQAQTPKVQVFNKGMLKSEEGRTLLTNAWRKGIDAKPNDSWGRKIQEALRSVKATSDAYSYPKRRLWKPTYDLEIEEILDAELELQKN